MSERSANFDLLPWCRPDSVQNFVPNRSRFFVWKSNSIFIAWRDRLALVLTFGHDFERLSAQKPLCCQILTSRESILDIITVRQSILVVSPSGLFQNIFSKDVAPSTALLGHLEDCRTLSLCDAFQLPSLQGILAVATVSNADSSPQTNYFAIITCSMDNNISAELYSLSFGTSHTCFKFEIVNSVNVGVVFKNQTCFISFLTKRQRKSIYPHSEGAETLLVGLNSGQLFCVPFCIPAHYSGVKLAAQLLYQSQWQLHGLACPPDGVNIYLVHEGGTVLTISPDTSQPSIKHQSVLQYTSFTLPYAVNHFSFPQHNLMFVSDFITTSVVHVVSNMHTDIEPIAVKGITTMTAIPGTNIVVASTLHGDFYLLYSSNHILKEGNNSSVLAGCSLDQSLRIVQDMKNQTELLSQLRDELGEEDSIIKALSAVTRAHLLKNHFKMTVKVIKIDESVSGNGGSEDEDLSLGSACAHIEHSYQISVEVKNNSPEEFSALLWKMSFEIRNPNGIILTQNFSIPRVFSQEFPFSALLSVPNTGVEFQLPIQVKASLVAEIREENVESQWLKIFLSLIELDISHFFSVSFQPPQFSRKQKTLTSFLDQIQLKQIPSASHSQESTEKAMMTSYIIPVPEKFRQPKILMEKLLCNCVQQQNLSMGKDFLNHGDKTVLWISLLKNTVKLEFRESCSSITLSSINLGLLHALKKFLRSMFDAGISSEDSTSSSFAASKKAEKLKTELGAISFKEVDGKQLLDTHQYLRRNISSQLY